MNLVNLLITKWRLWLWLIPAVGIYVGTLLAYEHPQGQSGSAHLTSMKGVAIFTAIFMVAELLLFFLKRIRRQST